MDHDDDVQIQDEHDTNIFLPFLQHHQTQCNVRK